MENANNVIAPVEADPTASWKFISSMVISAGSVIICMRNGWGTFYAILLFFPIFRVVKALVSNKSVKLIAGVLALIFFPVLTGSESLLYNALQKAVGTEKCNIYICRFVFMLVFFFSMMIASLVAKVFPVWQVQENLQRLIQKIIFGIALGISMVTVYWGIDYCNGRFIRLPAFITFLLPVVIILIAVGALIKMVRLVNGSSESGDKNSSAENDPTRLSEHPDTKLSDVAGMEEVKKQIRLRLVEPLKNPKLAEKYGLKAGGGVLLYGPPGTGKTFIARAVAGELNLPFYLITAADVFGRYVGESEKRIRELFQNARKNPLSVIFIDELEVLFSKRTGNVHETTQKVISVILQELDGVSQNKNPMLLMGATNTPWQVDEAFLRPGRFDILAFVDLPDFEARKQILKNAFKKGNLPMEDGLLDYIAGNTARFSGADLNGVVVKMRQEAFDNHAAIYSMDSAYKILLDTVPTSTGEILQQIREWEKQRKM